MQNSRYRRTPRLSRPESLATTSPQNKKLETYKLVFDLLKHLTTLSSGSILLLITLFEKVFKLSPPNYQLMLAFGGFLSSIGFAVVAMLMLAFNASDGALQGKEVDIFVWVAAIAWFFFTMGIIFTLMAAAPSFM